MASVVEERQGSQNKGNGQQINDVGKYRSQLLKWKSGKLEDFRKNKKNVQDKFSGDIGKYENHLQRKIYDKLLAMILKIQPSEASDESVDIDLGFCEEPYEGHAITYSNIQGVLASPETF